MNEGQDRFKQIEEQLVSVETQLQEFERMIFNLHEYSKIDKDTEVLIPIVNGMFAKGKTVETDKFLINVGNGIVVEKTKDEAINMLRSQISELEGYRNDLLKEFD